jgi:ABC-type antimicrobial peptide transport system permease subunit
MVVRSSGDPMQLIGPLKSVFAEVQPSIALTFRGLEAQLAASLRRERMLAALSALFGGVALALSMLGLYGVMAYSVARRRNELGVRIALGADNGRVLRLVLGDVARVIAIGIMVGAVGALASGKLVRSFLFGLEPAEPLVLVGAVAVLTAVALLSGFIPAWRASRLDPVQALREE